MKPLRSAPGLLALMFLVCAAAGGVTLAAAPADSASVKKLFADPPREYSTAPLWVWNDQLTEQQIRDTLRDLAAQKVRQVFVHPRPGLMTPYLSPDWFRLWKVALDEAKRLDLNCWIYDENSYPSGFAGGGVPESMPESRGRGLHLRVVEQAPPWDEATLAVYALDGAKASDVSAAARAGSLSRTGRYLVAAIQLAPITGWHGGRSYVDLLKPGVTQRFLDITLEAYRREVGGEFGRRIPGSFTDEPNIEPAGGLPWTDDLPAQFEQRRGYALAPNLPGLSQEVGDWRRIRHDYFHVLNALFVERWAQPYSEWCAKNGLLFTGHYWDHEWPRCLGVPDNMAMAAWQQQPGIDCLMNQYRETTHAQFGNVRIVRELASVANQLGRPRTLCEIYGAGGWDLRFEDMKRIGDWLGVLGVNLFDEHLSYVTLRGARKRDHPQSFSYHEPWWEAYHVNASYLTRMSAALSQGAQINRVLVLEPTTTAWMYQGNEERLREMGDAFFQFLKTLETAQVDYDLGDEDIMARHGSNAGAELVVGQRRYTTLVVPPGTENLESSTVKLLEKFLAAGGSVISCVEPPARVDGAVSERVARLAVAAPWRQLPVGDAVGALAAATVADGFAIRRQAGDAGILFHHRRHLADGDLLFLVNTSIERGSVGTVEVERGGVEDWDLYSGATKPAAFERTARGVKLAFALPPSGSRLLFFPKDTRLAAAPVNAAVTTIVATKAIETRRIGPNVLTLDHVDITAGGETRTNLYFYHAGQFAFQKNGMERNPWDSAVQFRDELLKKTFPAGSGFEASYTFTIEDQVPADLAIVIERPDLYRVTCNGQTVVAKAGEWWLDKAFGRIALAGVAKVGVNLVTLRCSPFSILHELEPAYVIGSFSLHPAGKGFVIAADQSLQLGRWNSQGLPFYSEGVAYRAAFDVTAPTKRTTVALPSWYGSVGKVLVNGQLAGFITAPPWTCDVSGKLVQGSNTVEVVVIGTLKNTVGPHHGKPPLGSAWPRGFQFAPKGGLPPGAEYDTVGYGLFEPFTLQQSDDRAAATP